GPGQRRARGDPVTGGRSGQKHRRPVGGRHLVMWIKLYSMMPIRISLASIVALSVAALSASGGDWPQWRGPARNGYASPDSPAISSLPKELKPVWKIPVGGGFSSPI